MKTRYVLLFLLAALVCLAGCIPNTTPEPPATTQTVSTVAVNAESDATDTPSPTAAVTPTAIPTTPAPTPTAVPTTPAPTPTPYPTPPDNWVAPFELGGHVNTWDHVDAMRYAGMTWAKVQVHYPKDAADIINTAHDNGLKIQITGMGSASLIREKNFTANYANWLATIAAQGADAIEVWTEPNIDREWPAGQIGPEAYTELLCAAYATIKAANPDTAVISAAPAPTGYFRGCSPDGCDDLPFLRGMLEAGAENCLDYVGAHHNAGATSPMADIGHPADPGSTHPSWYFLPQTNLYFDIFNGQRQLFYTEVGYASQEGVPTFHDMFNWAKATTDAQQADWLVGAVNLGRSTDKVYAMMIWNVDFERYGYDPQDGYAIIRPRGQCPACERLHNALVRTEAPPDQDRTALRLPWPAGEGHSIIPQSPPNHPEGFSFDLSENEPVMAAHSGWVMEVGEDEVLGNVVMLCRDQDTSGECSRYAHLKIAGVVVGQYIERGQEIALAGDMLFFSMLKDGEPIPAAFKEMDGGTSSVSYYISQNTP
ncbi:MAG: M23 family metallopeptidase [Anaerolineae bacterium]|nr:M23 family metallopeptidase [Anaerolineae bacterium]